MAEGLLIQPSNDDGEKEMEDVGDRYFDELFSRSFFQLSSSNKSRYVMHDLINDLANAIAKETCLHLEDRLKNDLLMCGISKTIRHSSITRDEDYETFDKFERFRGKENLRSLVILPIHVSFMGFTYISTKVVVELIPRMRHLRVLSLSNYKISEIPNSFGELKSLRYLNLSHTIIRCLPNSIGNLYNLQTLILSHCYCLKELPNSIGNLISLRCLDVCYAIRLKEMPAQIRKLEHLRILSDLIVGGSNTNLSIEDLRSMPPLRGEVCISIMENVVGVQDVRKGDLKLISDLESLVIKWESNSNDDGDSESESVLGLLQPHVNLKELRVESYSAPRFPRWVDDIAKFHKMVKLGLVNCSKCESLPCLGSLPSLECLSIERMYGVKGVGPEFYGCTGGTSTFKALKSLSFNDMPNWEDWSSPSSSMQLSFPYLHQLIIHSCPKLIKQLPAYLPSLRKLSIIDSPKLESPLVGLPSLHELEVANCNVEVLRSSGSDLTSLTTLTISGISGFVNLQQGFVGFLGALQDLRISGCPEMISPWEDGFRLENLHHHLRSGGRDGHQLESLGLGLGLGCNLKSLKIDGCSRLERLPNGWHLILTCLEQLSIYKCPELVSFPDHGFPPMLRDVSLANCESLQHLPDGMMMITRSSNNNSCRLECLRIEKCPSLTCFPKGQLPTTLKQLRLWDCEKLDCLPDGMMLMMCSNNTSTEPEDQGISCSQLEHLVISNCPSLTCFPNGSLPASLKQLWIYDCEKLESLPEGIMRKQQHQSSINIPSLEILTLTGCSSLTSFPQGSFPSTLWELELVNNPQLESISGEMFHHSTTPPNCSLLQHLSILKHPNLRTLPADSLYNLTRLNISDCENLEFEHNQFKNLTRLTSLMISNCKNIKRPLSQWGLAILPSLQSLSIQGLFPDDADSFSDTTDHHHQCYSNNLPPTLTALEISSFEKLESLASLSLQTLTSLRSLRIENCPKLRSILPREGVLPHTLAYLAIRECPLVEESYSREKGEYWPLLAHIPRVDIR